MCVPIVSAMLSSGTIPTVTTLLFLSSLAYDNPDLSGSARLRLSISEKFCIREHESLMKTASTKCDVLVMESRVMRKGRLVPEGTVTTRMSFLCVSVNFPAFKSVS